MNREVNRCEKIITHKLKRKS